MSSGGEAGGFSLVGDGLALLGGMLAGAYLTIGRRVRQSAGIGPYGSAVCGICALWLFLAAVGMDTTLAPPDTHAWIVLVAMALGPQLMGHVGFNYSVRYLSAAIVGAMVLLEPVGATILAIVILDEWPTVIEVIGGSAIVLGVGIATQRS